MLAHDAARSGRLAEPLRACAGLGMVFARLSAGSVTVPPAPCPIWSPALPDVVSEPVAQTDAEPVLPAKAVVVCEVDVDPADEETRPAVPSAVVPSPLAPRPIVPRLDIFGGEAVAVVVEVADEPFLALQGADVLAAAAPIRPTVLPCATGEPGAAVEPRLSPPEFGVAVAPTVSPPPSNVGSLAVLLFRGEHGVGFAAPKLAVAFCARPAPELPACNGDVACRPGIGSDPVCATLMLMPGPASAMTRARKPLICVYAFAMRIPEHVRAAETRHSYAKSQNRQQDGF